MRRDQILLGGILTVILVVFLVAFFLPQSRTIAQMKDELRDVRQQTLGAKSFISRLNELQGRHDAYTGELVGVDQKLPQGEALDRFLLSVSKILAEEKLLAGALEPRPPVRTDRLVEIPLRLSCSGRFDRLYRFLARVEALPRVTRVSEVSIVGPRTGSRGMVQLTLEVSVFSLGATDPKQTDSKTRKS
jgi:type IV pilus assembly protein PilO